MRIEEGGIGQIQRAKKADKDSKVLYKDSDTSWKLRNELV